jgi:hypothetical protein
MAIQPRRPGLRGPGPLSPGAAGLDEPGLDEPGLGSVGLGSVGLGSVGLGSVGLGSVGLDPRRRSLSRHSLVSRRSSLGRHSEPEDTISGCSSMLSPSAVTKADTQPRPAQARSYRDYYISLTHDAMVSQ